MIAPNIPAQILTAVRGQFEVVPSGEGRFVVYLPFLFTSGDQYPVVVRHDERGWYVTDEGETFSYLRDAGVSFEGVQRRELVLTCLAEHGVTEESGELLRRVEDDDWSDALFSFVQAIDQAVTVRHWTKERTANTFLEDVFTAIREVWKGPIERAWTDETVDPDKDYPIDFYIPGDNPWFIFATFTAYKCAEAALTVRLYHEKKRRFRPLAVVSDEGITKKARRQLVGAGVRIMEGGDREIMASAFSRLLAPKPN